MEIRVRHGEICDGLQVVVRLEARSRVGKIVCMSCTATDIRYGARLSLPGIPH